MTSQRSKTASAMAVQAPGAVAHKRVRTIAKKWWPKSAAPSGKLGKVVAMLKRPKGASIADLTKATGWQAHSVRGAISGAIKKKLKLAVLSEKTGEVRTYRIKG